MLLYLLLTLGTPLIHSIATIIAIAYRTLRLVTFYHFYKEKEGPYDFNARLEDAGVDLLKIFTQPVVLVGLELAALYGLLLPREGRKLYASIERAQYGDALLAPCFQPIGHVDIVKKETCHVEPPDPELESEPTS